MLPGCCKILFVGSFFIFQLRASLGFQVLLITRKARDHVTRTCRVLDSHTNKHLTTVSPLTWPLLKMVRLRGELPPPVRYTASSGEEDSPQYQQEWPVKLLASFISIPSSSPEWFIVREVLNKHSDTLRFSISDCNSSRSLAAHHCSAVLQRWDWL